MDAPSAAPPLIASSLRPPSRPLTVHRCNRWTCSNVNFCGGCDATICQGARPHPMCQHAQQPHCFAPRCEEYCLQQLEACSRSECSGCRECAADASPSPLALPTEAEEDAAASTPTSMRSTEPSASVCELSYLERMTAEFQSMVDAQRARNHELLRSLAPNAAYPSLPPAAPIIPPLPPSPPMPSPPPCVPVGHACGVGQHHGSDCCQLVGEPQRTCRWFTDFWSACVEVQR